MPSKQLKQQLDIWTKAFGRGVYPHQMTWFLDLPLRELIMPAATVADRLPVTSDATVVEVGPGSGYYSVNIAQKISNGRLILVDIQQEMLDKCLKKLADANIRNVQTLLSDAKTLPVGDSSADAITLTTVFGEISDRQRFLSEAHRALKTGGILSVTEHHPDPDFESAEQVIELVKTYQGSAFSVLQQLGWRWAHTVNFIKN